jgi:hypothetical protein
MAQGSRNSGGAGKITRDEMLRMRQNNRQLEVNNAAGIPVGMPDAKLPFVPYQGSTRGAPGGAPKLGQTDIQLRNGDARGINESARILRDSVARQREGS